MNARQQKAQAINRALAKEFGPDVATIINPLPLSDDQQLKVQIVDARRDDVVAQLCQWGWLPQYQHVQYRVNASNYGLIPASIYEIRIEHERHPIPQDRRNKSSKMMSTATPRRRARLRQCASIWACEHEEKSFRAVAAG